MTTLEQTISMIKFLPEADLLKVQHYAKSLQQRKSSTVSINQILNDLKVSRHQIQNNQCEEMGSALEKLRLKHGL